jgi:hypothetical protein
LASAALANTHPGRNDLVIQKTNEPRLVKVGGVHPLGVRRSQATGQRAPWFN